MSDEIRLLLMSISLAAVVATVLWDVLGGDDDDWGGFA